MIDEKTKNEVIEETKSMIYRLQLIVNVFSADAECPMHEDSPKHAVGVLKGVSKDLKEISEKLENNIKGAEGEAAGSEN